MYKSHFKCLLVLIILLVGCHYKKYPSHWWKAADIASAPKWEVLPQEAKPGEVILSKRNELGILSNFAATPFIYHGKKYASIEGFWVSLKYPENKKDERARFPGINWDLKRTEVEQMTAFTAKKASGQANKNMKLMKIDWVTFEGKKMTYRTSEKGPHYKLIKDVMWAKLQQNPKVKEVLMSTGNLKLVADHHVSKDDPPAWKYYDIWTEFRERIKNAEGKK